MNQDEHSQQIPNSKGGQIADARGTSQVVPSDAGVP